MPSVSILQRLLYERTRDNASKFSGSPSLSGPINLTTPSRDVTVFVRYSKLLHVPSSSVKFCHVPSHFVTFIHLTSPHLLTWKLILSLVSRYNGSRHCGVMAHLADNDSCRSDNTRMRPARISLAKRTDWMSCRAGPALVMPRWLWHSQHVHLP